MKTYRYNDLGGLVIEAQNSNNLSDLDSQYLKEKMKIHGFVLLRNFDSSLEEYNTLVKRCSSRITLDPARKFYNESAQMIDAGLEAVGLHIENGVGPVIPDMCWFYCRLSPEVGSQTTVCDGKNVFENMPSNLKEIFKDTTITYSRNLPENIWKTYVSHEFGHKVPMDQIGEEHINIIQSKLKNLNITMNNDGSILYKFEINPILNEDQNHFFANSILGPSYNYEVPTITLKDGTIVGEEIKKELAELTEKFTVNIDWKDGDIILIDNKRVMHGRRKIIATRREIFNALSFN